MKRAVMALFAALALLVAVPIASAPAKAAPAIGSAVATPGEALVTKAHSARWYRARRWGAYYGPRPFYGPRPYWHRRHYWGPRPYYGPRRFYGHPHWRHRW
jgi:hypothetical protein